MIGWWRSRQRYALLVGADAAALIEALGEDGAFHEARRRSRLAWAGSVVDHDRPARHWTKVSVRIIDMSHGGVGLDTATRYLQS